MRDNTFTPGPWRVGPVDDTMVFDARGNEVATIDGDYNHPDTWPIMEANARLIAAAPDMCNALWETIELSDRNLTEAGRTPECQRVYDIVRAALAKAEGSNYG